MHDALTSRPSPLESTPIRVAIVASLLVHALLILQLPQFRSQRLDLPGPAEQQDRLTVRLVPPFAAPAEPATPVPPPPPAQRARPRPAPPPVIAVDRPAAPPPPAATPRAPAPAGDLLAYVESRRSARSEASAARESPAPAARDDERARANRIAAANLATQRQITFGYDPSRSGGVFTIDRLTSDYAEFTFVGWNSDAQRRTKQVVEVRKGSHGDIRLAVVREMIAIIRRYEPVEFTWESRHLNRVVTLSSLARDNAGLEDFMLKEFF